MLWRFVLAMAPFFDEPIRQEIVQLRRQIDFVDEIRKPAELECAGFLRQYMPWTTGRR